MYNRGMSILGVLAGIVILGLAGALAFSFTRQAAPAPQVQQPKEIRWLLTRDDVGVFARAQTAFADTLARETGGSLILRIVTPADIGQPPHDVPQDTLVELLRDGRIEMTAVESVALGYNRPAFWAVTMPFLFDSYSGAGTALTSDMATRMFATLDNSPMRALAFTSGGGFRIIATKNTSIRTSRDLAGKKILTAGGSVAEETLKALGATPIRVASSTEDIADLGSADGIETTYARFMGLGTSSAPLKIINETNHSLATKVIVVQSDFFAALAPLEQEALKRAAQAAAQAEDGDAIALASTTRDQLRANGITIVDIPSKLRDIFATMVNGVAELFASSTDPSLIAGLKSASH